MMPGRTDTSPSPAPDAPVPAAPGPRAAALQKVYSASLKTSLEANSYSNFSACFPTPAKYCPTALEGVWKQLNARLEEECTRDFEKIMEERSVVEGLNQWDALIDDARRRKNRAVEGEAPGRPPHTFSPEELHIAHLRPYLQTASNELEGKLQSTQDQNEKLIQSIVTQREEMERVVGGLESIIKDIEDSVASMETPTDSDMQQLRDDTWAMEQEIAATK